MGDIRVVRGVHISASALFSCKRDGGLVHRLTRSLRGVQCSRDTAQSAGRRYWSLALTRIAAAVHCEAGPPQVWVKGGAIDFYALSDGGLQLGVGR